MRPDQKPRHGGTTTPWRQRWRGEGARGGEGRVESSGREALGGRGRREGGGRGEMRNDAVTPFLGEIVEVGIQYTILSTYYAMFTHPKHQPINLQTHSPKKIGCRTGFRAQKKTPLLTSQKKSALRHNHGTFDGYYTGKKGTPEPRD